MSSRLDTCPESLRSWEWHYLYRLANHPAVTCRGHEAAVTAVAISPDDELLASASADLTVRIWDPSTGEQLHCCRGHKDVVTCLAFLPSEYRLVSDGADAPQVVSGGADGQLRLWDVDTGDCLAVVESPDGAITALVIEGAGKTLLVGHNSGRIVRWHVNTGRLQVLHDGGDADIETMVLSQDGSQLVTGEEGRARLWQVGGDTVQALNVCGDYGNISQQKATSLGGKHFLFGGNDQALGAYSWAAGEFVKGTPMPGGLVTAVAASPDGQWIASGAPDGSLGTWEAETLECTCVLRGHSDAIQSIAFDSSSRMIVTGGDDRTVRVWRSPIGFCDARGIPVRAIPCTVQTARRACLSSGGVLARVGTDFLELWDSRVGCLNVGRRIEYSGDGVVSMNNDGELIARGRSDRTEGTGQEHGEIILYGRADMHELWRSGELNSTLSYLAFSRDNRLLAVASGGATKEAPKQRWVQVRDVATGRIEQQMESCIGGCMSIQFDPTGCRLLGAGADGVVRVWDVESGRVLLEARGHEGPVRYASYSPDGGLIASAGEDSTVRIWGAVDGGERRKLVGHNSVVHCVSFHPDGKRVVSGGQDGTVRIWDANSGQELLKLHGLGTKVYHVAFADEGRTLIAGSGDGPLAIYETTVPDALLYDKQRTNAEANRLFDKYIEKTDFAEQWINRIIDQVNGERVSAEVKEAFARTAALRGQNAFDLEHRGWMIAEEPDRTQAEYEYAARAARRACEIAPDNLSYLHTLGVAEYRAQNYDAALAIFERTTRERGAPHDHAFLAMVQYQLGMREAAETSLRTAQETVHLPEYRPQGHLPRFVQEAEHLILGDDPQSEHNGKISEDAADGDV